MKTAIAAMLLSALVATAGGIYVALQFKATAPAPSLAAPRDAIAALFAAPLTDPAGTPVTLARWRDETLVVNFWATWCPPCLDEMPDLSRLQESHKNVRFVGVAIDAPAKVAAFSDHHPVSYPLLVAASETLALSRELGNATEALPYTLVVRNGKIKWTKIGRVDATQLDSYLQALAASTGR